MTLVSHLMANRRFAILALIGGTGKLGPVLRRDVEEIWPTPFERKSFGCEIAKLQHAGLVESEAGQTRDKRSSLYSWTDAGRRFAVDHTAVLEKLVLGAQRLQSLGAEDADEDRPDMRGMAFAAVLLRKRAVYKQGAAKEALLEAAVHIEEMREELT